MRKRRASDVCLLIWFFFGFTYALVCLDFMQHAPGTLDRLRQANGEGFLKLCALIVLASPLTVGLFGMIVMFFLWGQHRTQYDFVDTLSFFGFSISSVAIILLTLRSYSFFLP